jgi:hypothetical protein
VNQDNFQPKIQEILLENKGPKKKGVFCETFVYQPKNIDEIKLGSLFILGRLEEYPDASHIINLLTSIIKREYYSNSKRKPLKSLEDSFKKANAALADLTKSSGFSWLGKMDFVCAVLVKDILHITKIGRSKIFLMREGSMVDIGKKLVSSSPQKVFHSIASGKIFLHDKIVLATGDIFKHIPSKGLKQIVEIGELNQLKKIIEESKNFSAQGLVLIETVREEELPAKPFETIEIKPDPLNSLQSGTPILPESKFSALKSEISLIWRNFWLKSKDRWKAIKQSIEQQQINNRIKTAAKTSAASARDLILPKNTARINTQEKGKISPFNRETLTGLRAAGSFSKNKRFEKKLRKVRLILRNLPYLTAAAVGSSWREFKKDVTPRAKKILLAIIIILIVSSFATRYFLNQKYQKQILTNEDKSKQAQEKFEQINKTYRLDNFGQSVNLSEDNSFTPEFLAANDNTVFAAGIPSQKLYYFTASNTAQNPQSIDGLPQEKTWQKAISINDNSLILLSRENKFYKYNLTTKSLSELSIKLPSQETKIQDIAAYKNNLYILDSTNNQIIKCSDFKDCQIWITDDLRKGVSMAVDGSIYVLKNDGSIATYFAGRKQNQTIPEIKPGISNSARLITAENLKNIYILDKETKRIAILTKENQLIKQYYVDIPGEIKDFQLSNDEKNIFILADNKIYQIAND